MKRWMKLLLFAMVAVAVHPVRAQTAEESANWLQIKLRTFSSSIGHPDATLVSGGRMRAGMAWRDQRETKHCNLDFSDVTDVVSMQKNIRYTRDGNVEMIPVISILISGRVRDYDDDDNSTVQAVESQMEFRLSPNTSQQDVERIIKAIRYLATLNHAKLVNDELFK